VAIIGVFYGGQDYEAAFRDGSLSKVMGYTPLARRSTHPTGSFCEAQSWDFYGGAVVHDDV
jgi:hypothetical protein